jgi:hypothetical protein
MFKKKSSALNRKITTLKSKECTSFEQNTQPRYKKIIEHVKNMNSVVIHDIAISGEGVYGAYSIITEITFLRLCIENDLYHPNLYRWCVGVSVGSIIIVCILNVRYLYECHSKEIALEYLTAIENFIEFDNLRKVFFNLGENKTVGDFAPSLLFKNLFYEGAICSREALIQLLQGNHPNLKFNNKKQYFLSKEYYKWLKVDNNLNNVFIVCYAQSQTKMVVFTGNDDRFLDGTNYVDYEKMTPDNLIHAVICSSSVTLLYPQPLIRRDRAIDGASAEVNQFLHLQILINVSVYFSFNLIITPLFLFFGINPIENSDFLIIINKRNIQYLYEDLLQFKQYSNPLINSIATQLSIGERRKYNSITNVSLTALYLGQPFVKDFSTNNITENILDALKTKNNILKQRLPLIKTARKKHKRIPTFLLTEEEFLSKNDIFCLQKYFKCYNDYKKMYLKYNAITSNLITSTNVYVLTQDVREPMLDRNYNEQLDKNGNPIEISINYIIFDQFVRTSYRDTELALGILSSPIAFELNLFFKNDTGFTDTLTGTGFFSANAVFDIHLRQSLYTMKKSYVKSDSLLPFVNEIEPVYDEAVKSFLGPKPT